MRAEGILLVLIIIALCLGVSSCGRNGLQVRCYYVDYEPAPLYEQVDTCLLESDESKLRRAIDEGIADALASGDYNGSDGSDGQDGIDGIDGINGINGINGVDGLFVAYIDPCGDEKAHDELLYIDNSGQFHAWFKDVGHVILNEGTLYQTTDGSSCKFKIISGQLVDNL